MIASALVQNGISIADISVILGYRSVQTTERIYLTTSKKHAAREVKALDILIKATDNDIIQNKLDKL